jgi:hypothetical protein
MKPIKSLLILAVVLAPGLAAAQGYYGGPGGGPGYGPPPVPGGFHNRAGRLAWGFSVGLGGIHDDGGSFACNGCNYNPLAFEIDGHIGGMLSPRFALLFEVQANGQTISSDAYADTEIVQSALMVAAQYWITPQFWLKGGIGFADLQIQDSTNYTQDLGGGSALMGAAGFELMSARFFAVDLQGRIIEGNYHGLDDHVTSATIGVGINWY